MLDLTRVKLESKGSRMGDGRFLTFRQKRASQLDNRASLGVGTAQGQQVNVMAASLLDQNSRSLFHKQRVFLAQTFSCCRPGWPAGV